MKSWSFAGFVGGVLLVSTLFACPAYAQQNNNGNAFGNALEAGLNAQRRKSLVEMETASRISEIEGLYKSKDQTTPRIRGLREEYKQRLLVVQRLSKSGAQIDFDAEINRIAAQYSTDKNNATTFSLLSVGKMFEKSGNDRAIQNAIRVAEEARQRLLVAEEQFAREQVPLKEARNHVENRRWTEAEEQFTALTQMDSENADYWSGLAFAVENQAGREEEAITIYRKSIERDSKNPDTHYDFARLLQRLERAEDALKEMRSATRLAPGSATFQAGLGSISADQRRYQNALVYYDIATMLSPNDERFLAERKSVGEQVQAHCEDALKADSENVTTRNLLSTVV